MVGVTGGRFESGGCFRGETAIVAAIIVVFWRKEDVMNNDEN